MKKLFAVLIMMLGLVGSAQAQVQQYGSAGGSVEGREYWFNNPGGRDNFNRDLKATYLKRESFPSCDLQRVLMRGRWQTCRTCGYVSRNSFPNLSTTFPTECM